MIKEIALDGFKRHGRRRSGSPARPGLARTDYATRVPLAPVTLLLGSNSAGKSSVFQSLLALKQSMARAAVGFADLETSGASVDLGRFENLQTLGDRDRTVYVRVGFDRESSVALGFLDPAPHPVTDSTNTLGWMELERGPQALRSRAFGEVHDGRGHAVEFVRVMTGAPVPAEPEPEGEPPLVVLWDSGQRSYDVLLGSRPLSPDDPVVREVRPIVDGTLYRLDELVRRIRYIGPLRAPGARAYRVQRSLADEVGSRGEHLATALRRGDRAARVGELLPRVGVPYSLRVKDLDGLSELLDIRLVSTEASERAKAVGLADVGFGVSQLLPILAEWAGYGERAEGARSETTSQRAPVDDLFLVEQPELHLHPRWQTRLMYVLSETAVRWRKAGASGPFDGVQVVLETHSKTIVRTVQQLVRLGRLRPDDVSIVSFEVDPEGGPSVERIHLDEGGEFERAWPKGFFEEEDDLLYSDEVPL